MSVFRVEKNKNYTVMSNVHLRDKTLSLKAKGLLAMILSLPDDWHYSVHGLVAICKESKASIISGLKELENSGYLTRRQLRDEKGQMADIEYTIYEEPRSPCADFRQTDNRHPDLPQAGKPHSDNQPQINKEVTNTETQNTEINKYSIKSYQEVAEITADEMRKERECYRELIKKNIEYDILTYDNKHHDDVDELVEIMLDAVCSRKPFIRIGGDDKPASVVKSQLLKLDSSHIQYVQDCMRENTTKVRNIRQYLLTTLYNAPLTISSYYSALVNHHMYGGNS